MKMLAMAVVSLVASVSLAAPTKLSVDTKASTIAWKGSKTVTKSSHNGFISLSAGSVEIEKGELKTADFTVDMKTITNEDMKASPKDAAKLVGHLSSEDFFHVAKFPTATFKTTSITKKSATEVVIKGDFTMIGKTVPVEFPAKVEIKGDSATGEATLKIDRTLWGLKYGSGKFFTGLGDKVISDEIEFTLKIAAKK